MFTHVSLIIGGLRVHVGSQCPLIRRESGDHPAKEGVEAGSEAFSR